MPCALLSTIGLDLWSKVRRGASWAQFWARGIMLINDIHVHVHGRITGKCGMLLVSNHLGYLDILVHASQFKLRFTPNDGIKRWFLVGTMVRCSYPVWIDRRSPRKAAEYVRVFRKTMENSVSLLVYPEGTSTDGRHGMLPFKSTVFSSLDEHTVIQPTVLFYRDNPEKISAAWFDHTGFAVHAWRVLGLKRTDIDMYVLEQMFDRRGEHRRDLANRVREAMIKEYNKHA